MLCDCSRYLAIPMQLAATHAGRYRRIEMTSLDLHNDPMESAVADFGTILIKNLGFFAPRTRIGFEIVWEQPCIRPRNAAVLAAYAPWPPARSLLIGGYGQR